MTLHIGIIHRNFLIQLMSVHVVVAGGLSAVLWTDAIQTVILVGGAACLTFIGK